MTTVNVALLKSVDLFIKGYGDLNDDNVIDVNDVMLLVWEVLRN